MPHVRAAHASPPPRSIPAPRPLLHGAANARPRQRTPLTRQLLSHGAAATAHAHGNTQTLSFPFPTAGAEPALPFQPSPAPLPKTRGTAQIFLLDALAEQLGAIRALNCPQISSGRPTRELFHPAVSIETALSRIMEKARSSTRVFWPINDTLRLWRGPWEVVSHTAPTPGPAGRQQD